MCEKVLLASMELSIKNAWHIYIVTDKHPYCVPVPYVCDPDIEPTGVTRDSVGNYHMRIVSTKDGSVVCGEWLMNDDRQGGPSLPNYWRGFE